MIPENNQMHCGGLDPKNSRPVFWKIVSCFQIFIQAISNFMGLDGKTTEVQAANETYFLPVPMLENKINSMV